MSDTKLQGYREKVAEQRYRTEQHMAKAPTEIREQWYCTTTTIRKSVYVDEFCLILVNGKRYEIVVDSVNWDGEEFTATAHVYDDEDNSATLNFGAIPVNIAPNTFVNVDNLSPFHYGDKTQVRLIFYVNQPSTVIH